LRLLADQDFSAKYWALCDRHPNTSSVYRAKKEDVLEAFAGLGVKTKYDGRDRSFVIEAEEIGGMRWDGLLALQRHGPELMVGCTGPQGRVGSNFAVLAYEAMRVSDPSFSRSSFSCPAPYPRPFPAGKDALVAVVTEFVELVRSIELAVREFCTAPQASIDHPVQ
jgi:hypothetical protein